MIRSPWIQLNRFAIKSVIEWKIWEEEGRKSGNLFARMISLPPLHPRPLLTVVGKYSRGSPMEKLGKYQGNSISGLNSTSSRSLLFRFSLSVFQLFRNWICIYTRNWRVVTLSRNLKFFLVLYHDSIHRIVKSKVCCLFILLNPLILLLLHIILRS